MFIYVTFFTFKHYFFAIKHDFLAVKLSLRTGDAASAGHRHRSFQKRSSNSNNPTCLDHQKNVNLICYYNHIKLVFTARTLSILVP